MFSLGDIGAALDAPRRQLWTTLGLPATGAEVASQYLGMDPESAWTKALGVGLETLGDPTILAAGLGGALGLGSAMGRASAAGRLAKAAGLESRAARMAEAAQGFSKGAANWERAGAGIDDLVARRPWMAPDFIPPPERVPVMAKDIPAINHNLRRQAVRYADANGIPRLTPAQLADARSRLAQGHEYENLMNQVLGEINDVPPMADLPGMMRQAAQQTYGQIPGILNQASAVRNAPVGLFEEAYLHPERMSALEKAIVGGTFAGALGGGVYSGLNQ